MKRDRRVADGPSHGPDAGTLRLAQIVDAPALQSMMDDFCGLTNIPMALIDLDGRVVVGAGWQDVCTRFHRVNPETCAHCVSSDTVLSADIPPGETRLYRCRNGIWDAATPVLVGDARVGNLFAGQFFFEDEEIDLEFFRARAALYGFDEPDYLRAVQSVPRLSRDTVETGLRFLTRLASMISQLSVSNLERARAEASLQSALSAQTKLANDIGQERGILQAIMENTETHLAYLDTDFNFVAVNSAYCIGSGHVREELIGRNHFELFPDVENQAIFEHVRATGEAAEFRAKPFVFAGQPWRGVTYWDWRLSPVRDDGGVLQGFAFSLVDVTRAFRQKVFSDAINRLDDIIHSDLDVAGVLAHIVPELVKATGVEVVVTAVRSPAGRWDMREAVGVPDALRDRVFTDAELPYASESLRSGRAVFASADESNGSKGLLGYLGLQTMLVVPLSVAGQQLGAVVYGYRSGPGEFDEYVVDFAGKFGASLSLALNNARLFHDVMHAARLSGALAKVNEILLSALTFDDVMARLVGEVSQVAGADKSLVIDVRDDKYTITHVRNVGSRLVGKVHGAAFFPAFALAAVHRQPLLIDDNWADPRTNKEFVVPNKLRAFQLLPLTVQGRVTSVLALAYDSPQSFDSQDLESAERMTAAMSVALNNARLYENEHRIADRLQEALLALPREIDGIEFAHAYHSASEAARVGGDFYDIFELSNHQVGLTIGDVAGKGLDAAVLTSLAKNSIRAHASEKGKTPSRILSLTNDVVFRATPPDSFVTLFFGILDCTEGRFVYASAGHPAGIVVSKNRIAAALKATGPLLGAFEGSAYDEAEVRLGVRDALFLYTDGLTEARGGQGFYGERRLHEYLPKWYAGSVRGLVEEAVTDVLAFSGGRLRDDLAILALRRSAAQARKAKQLAPSM